MASGCQEFIQASKLSVSNAFVKFLEPDTIEKDSCFKGIGKCVALVLTVPIALIEGVVRGVFALLVSPIALFLPEGNLRNWYNEHIFTPLAIGSLKSFMECSFSIGRLGLGVTALIGKVTDRSTQGNVARMPPSIWCKKSTAPA